VRATEAARRAVACSRCKALVGAACVDAKGRSLDKPHRERLAAYQATRKLGRPAGVGADAWIRLRAPQALRDELLVAAAGIGEDESTFVREAIRERVDRLARK